MTVHRIARWEWLLVVGLLLIAFGLRTHDLLRVPPGLHNDEVAFAEITETVTHGRLAIFFPENIGNEGLAYYFAAPFMKVLGLNVLAIRLPAAFISLIAACLIWALTRRLFGPLAAMAALAAFTVIFWTVAFGRIGLHVVLMVPLATLAAHCLWRAQGAPGRRVLVWWALCGLCLGLAIDTYTAARILPVILVVFGLYLVIAHRAEWKKWWSGMVLALLVAALVAAPLFITLAQNPAEDQLGFFDIDQPLRELRQGQVQPVLETSLRTLGMFGFVGDPLPYYGIPERPFLDPVAFLLLLGGLLIALWRWRKPAYAFLFIWFFISLAPGMLSQPAPNSTRTLAVQTVLFTLIGIAVSELVTLSPYHRVTVSLRHLVIAFFVLAFAGNLLWTAHDYFTVWPSLPDTRFWYQAGLKAVADHVQRDADTSPVVVCLPDHLIDEREPWWYPAWRHVRFLLDRPDVAWRYTNCADTLILPEGVARYAFPDAADEATLQRFPITALLQQADRTELPDRLGAILRVDRAATPLADRLQQAALSPVKFEGANEATTLPIDLGGKVDFLGYTLSQQGRDAELITYWRVKDRLPPQLSQFTHVLNDRGDIVTQQDRLMLTSQTLQPGDIVIQIHHLTLPGDLPSGSYPIAIGLYTQPDGQRLPVAGHSDRLVLQALQAP